MKAVFALAAVAVALIVAPAAVALCMPTHYVAVGADGPLAPELHVPPGSRIGLEDRTDGLETRLVFDAPPCETARPIAVGVPVLLFCTLVEPGSYPYRVEGFGAGTGVVVVDPVEWVTLAAARRVVVFGEKIRLGGTAYDGVSCAPPSTERPRVLLEGRSVAAARFVRRASAPFGASRWRVTVAPRVSTLYRAVWADHTSGLVRVDVRPRVTLRRAGGGHLRVTARSARTYRGRWVAVQRRTARGWRFVRAVRLGPGSASSFRAPRRRGLVRVYVPRSAAGRGYIAGFSRPLRLR